jgi:hypothetical protein
MSTAPPWAEKRREISAEVLERLRTLAFERKPRNEATVEPNTDTGGPSPTGARGPPILDATRGCASVQVRAHTTPTVRNVKMIKVQKCTRVTTVQAVQL